MLAIENEGSAVRVSCEKKTDATGFVTFDASRLKRPLDRSQRPILHW